MTTVNGEYLKLPGSYLFSEIARRVAAFTEKIRTPKLSAWALAMLHALCPWQ
jgi:LL-diaminopimelate aminotransferase apoenzyme (EC 2.6.1.83)